LSTIGRNSIGKGVQEAGQESDEFYTWRMLDQAQFAIARLRDMELARSGITPEQTAILTMLHVRAGKSTITELASIWMRQRNSISTLVHRMAKQGLVKKIKRPGHKDLEIRMTGKGKTLLLGIRRDSIVEAFSPLSRREVEVLNLLLEKLLLKSRQSLGLSRDLIGAE
jgi:DNA-binding MarR family transcriptional regulator